MERKTRRTIKGVVVSDKNDKTIVVLVETYKKHPKYSKRVKYSKKYYAHDELNKAHTGDVVTIMETRKLSATKRFRLVSIDKLHVSDNVENTPVTEEVVTPAAPVVEETPTVVEEVKEETPVVEEVKKTRKPRATKAKVEE